MKITSAEFLCSVTKPAMFPVEKLPEFVFVGRSNVGKSSLINCLLNRKGLAKTSSAPGKTQTINFYKINKKLYFVDLPGYGYAKVPKEVRKGWKPMVEGYFNASRDIRATIALFDIRRDMDDNDRNLLEWLESMSINIVIVLTKSDKISRSNREKQLLITKNFLQGSRCDIVIFSALKKEGRDALWRAIVKRVN